MRHRLEYALVSALFLAVRMMPAFQIGDEATSAVGPASGVEPASGVAPAKPARAGSRPEVSGGSARPGPGEP